MLSNAELLQILIGSGNAQSSVARIAKRSLKQLTKHGSKISFNELLKVDGLGPARACQIIAAFELASRFPVLRADPTISSVDDLIALADDARSGDENQIIFVTLDGGKRLIAQRALSISDEADSLGILRTLFTQAISDNATRIDIVIGSRNRELEISLFEQGLVHDFRQMAQVLDIKAGDCVIVNKESMRRVDHL